MPVSAASIRCGPSRKYDSTRNGSGGIRLAHTTSATRSTLPTFFVTIFPSAHETAAHSVRRKPATVIACPPCMPISARPPAAIRRPITFCAPKRSCRNSPANSSVKNACACSTSEASPAGMPTYIAVKRNANWPNEIVARVGEQPAQRQLRTLHEEHCRNRGQQKAQRAEQHRRHAMQTDLDHDKVDAPRHHDNQRQQ